MKRLLTPILLVPMLLAGCSDDAPDLSPSIDAYNGDRDTLDLEALNNAVKTEAGRAAIADAVAANPLLDFDGTRLAFAMREDVVSFIQIYAPDGKANVEILLVAAPVGDSLSPITPKAQINSVDLDGNQVTVIVEIDGADLAKYDIELTGKPIISVNAFTGEVIDPMAQP